MNFTKDSIPLMTIAWVPHLHSAQVTIHSVSWHQQIENILKLNVQLIIKVEQETIFFFFFLVGYVEERPW